MILSDCIPITLLVNSQETQMSVNLLNILVMIDQRQNGVINLRKICQLYIFILLRKLIYHKPVDVRDNDSDNVPYACTCH
jgi:hypothetical protein